MDLYELARFSRDYISDYRIYENHREQLPNNMRGNISDPKADHYWQKGIGVFSADDYGEFMSLEMPNEGFDLLDSFFLGDLDNTTGVHWEADHHVIAEVQKKNLLYMGQYCVFYSADQAAVREKDYMDSFSQVDNHGLEKILVTVESSLDGYDGRALSRILRILETKKITVKKSDEPSPNSVKLAVLRLIAGALQVYYDPLWVRDKAVEAGLAKHLMPSKRAKKAAERLLAELDEAEAIISWRGSLQSIANGEPLHPVMNKESRIRTLVREVSILSHELFDITNNKANRFPTSAIHRILDIVGEDVSESTIVNHQRPYDDSSESALSSYI